VSGGVYRDAHEFEAEPGLPEPLPAGERVLWRGAPEWRGFALRVFHVRKVAIYFTLLLLWRALETWTDTHAFSATATATLTVAAGGAAAVALLALLAWLSARATIYTITDKRVVMRIGVALPLSINLPFKVIGSAGLHIARDGRGDIAFTLATSDRIGWIHLWPHARPWQIKSPQPMLRALARPHQVAALLSRALADATGGTARHAVAPAETQPSGALPLPATT
jgi:Bacterial PH domain